MTAITINIPDKLAAKLHELSDPDQFVTGLLTDNLDFSLEEDLTEEEAEALAVSNAQACMDSMEAYKRGEYMTLKEFMDGFYACREARKK
jgi:hypothetical protein